MVNERLRRIGSIVKADFLIRFRRASTLAVFLLLSISTYLWIPDPSSGYALLTIEGQRAIYNSAAIAIGTALLGTIVVGLIGYYVISNAVAMDIRSRCGFVIASTNMGRFEYLFGKFLGNVTFLSTFMAGYMVASMVMVVVRGEAGLEPLAFIGPYVLLAPPAILFVSAAAIIFESVPGLGGRFGDIFWFFLWILWSTMPAMVLELNHSPEFVRYLDFSGLGYVMTGLKGQFDTTAFSIGASRFDAAGGLLVIQGLPISTDWLVPRIGACIIPFALLPVALLFFHRFDPARIKQGRDPLAVTSSSAFRGVLQPLTQIYGILKVRSRRIGDSLWAAAREDAYVTIRSAPLLAVTVPILVVTSLLIPVGLLRTILLPVIFSIVAVLIADIPTRERERGLVAMIFAAPRLKTGYVLWKLMTTILVSLMLVSVPLVRLTLTDLTAAASLLTGTVFMCATGLALGIISSNPKTFLALFFIFGYAVVNDGGRTPGLDFAGFYGTANPCVIATYLGAALISLVAAQALYSARLRREG